MKASERARLEALEARVAKLEAAASKPAPAKKVAKRPVAPGAKPVSRGFTS